MSTGKKKIKIELEDDDGGKYNLSLEGNLSKDKIQRKNVAAPSKEIWSLQKNPHQRMKQFRGYRIWKKRKRKCKIVKFLSHYKTS